jgi:S-adenosylmethionine-diacylgycerolhomoserine-N-methlytransferase
MRNEDRNEERNAQSLATYYRWHAGIYDFTRWFFLFGRTGLIDRVTAEIGEPRRILEIGCGTGKNLVALAGAFPKARITGLDLSKDMLDRAAAKVAEFDGRIDLLHQAYDGPVAKDGREKFDLIVFSYSLSMINPGYDEVLTQCRADLSPHGAVAVVDFHETRWAWFRRWMGVNHVRMEGQILTQLSRQFEPLECRVRRGYGDLWRYLIYIGRLPAPAKA